MIAITKSRWINPPKVYEVTSPNAQSTTRSAAIVTNMEEIFSV